MTGADRISHEFVEHIPDKLQDRTLYISVRFATATHLCLCGCGSEVVTPLSPTDWRLTFDGETVSLDPSVGSWSLPCQSHYWIQRDRGLQARQWGAEEIEAVRQADKAAKRDYYAKDLSTEEDRSPRVARRGVTSAIAWIRRLFGG